MTVSPGTRPHRGMPPWAALVILWIIGATAIVLALVVGWALFEVAWLAATR